MPKGQKRDETARLSDIEERIKKLREQKTDLLSNKVAREKRTRQRKANLLGTSLLDGDLTPQEHAVIAGILARRKERPADWDLLADWLPVPIARNPAEQKAAE